jgi:hypothetical protein
VVHPIRQSVLVVNLHSHLLRDLPQRGDVNVSLPGIRHPLAVQVATVFLARQVFGLVRRFGPVFLHEKRAARFSFYLYLTLAHLDPGHHRKAIGIADRLKSHRPRYPLADLIHHLVLQVVEAAVGHRQAVQAGDLLAVFSRMDSDGIVWSLALLLPHHLAGILFHPTNGICCAVQAALYLTFNSSYTELNDRI